MLDNFNQNDSCIHDCDNCPYFEIVDCICLLQELQEWIDNSNET